MVDDDGEVTRNRFVVWDKQDAGWGTEAVEVSLAADRFTASGVAIGWDPVAYRLSYTLETGAGWISTRLVAATRGEGWQRRLDLRRSATGTWTVTTELKGEVKMPQPGGDVSAFASALDCDLGRSPLTNSMPVLRHDLLRCDETLEFVMAWVSVPDLAVVASAQRYSTVPRRAAEPRRIEYTSIQRDFVAELTFDRDGLVIDYPHLAQRVESA
ncbi:MAG: putative glycolipid-binding domain-containing protein [Chloroflexi bacterium]|jgi:hypothetical protein|nr:putative glycolipid-binding domain-containing protein [Chloroflexota bacterium]